MSLLEIADLNFFAPAVTEKCAIKGSGIDLTGLTPSLSTSISTSADTLAFSNHDVKGNALDGFKLNLIGYGGAAGSAAGAASIGGAANTQTVAGNFIGNL